MADEEKKDSQNPEEQKEESGLGNLPPLSDFDSQADSDGGLPPLGGFDSDAGDSGGLPPISDIQVEEPTPAGGNIKPAPPGFESANGEFSSGGDAAVDTPAGGGDFQNFAADSDFSPETPEIGPGPESDVNTPMFDSAFGGGQDFDAAVDTPAPTQAMETPMFGGENTPSDGGFDAGAFGGGTPDAGATPPPDFSPDTGMQDFGMAAGAGAAAAPPPPAKRGGVGVVGVLLMLIIGAVIGLVVGPIVANKTGVYPEAINPYVTQLTELNNQVQGLQADKTSLKRQLDKYISTDVSEGGLKLTPEQKRKLGEDIAKLKGELAQLENKYRDTQQNLARVQAEVDRANEQFVKTSEEYETLANQLALTQARRDGLQAEVTRLTDNVGGLEVAEERRVAAKKALEHAVDRLVVQIKEGMPLTPAKYDHAARLAAAEDLRRKVASAKWVTPALLEAYTNLYVKELEIANSTEYFFAKVRVTDRFGNPATKWAECVMNGNWGVKYRTLDGRNVGVYQNLANMGAPIWGFKEDYPAKARDEIDQTIVASRPDGWEAQIKFLLDREEAAKENTPLQRAYNSL